MESLVELMKQRRSIRRFLPDAVEPEKVDLLMKSALMAPTSKNCKSWIFIVVDDPALLSQLAQSRSASSSFLANAPLAVVVLSDPSKSDCWLENASISSAFLQLQAQALGLSSCWVQIARRPHNETVSAEQYVRDLLKIPEELNVVNVIAIGYKNEERLPHDVERLPFEKIHRNRY